MIFNSNFSPQMLNLFKHWFYSLMISDFWDQYIYNSSVYLLKVVLFPKLFWPAVRNICSSDLLKFESEGREFEKKDQCECTIHSEAPPWVKAWKVKEIIHDLNHLTFWWSINVSSIALANDYKPKFFVLSFVAVPIQKEKRPDCLFFFSIMTTKIK